MSNLKTLKFDDGIEFGIGSFVHGNADVLVSAETVLQLTDEDIGARVRRIAHRAVQLFAIELLDNWDKQPVRLGNEPGKNWLISCLGTLNQYEGTSPEVNRAIEQVDGTLRDLERREENRRRREEAAKPKPGLVYLAYCDTGHYKIGISKNPKKRIRIFNTKMPVSVELVHSFDADDARGAESRLHDIYQDKRHEGEWFSLTSEDAEEIKAIGGFEAGEFV